jgi:hypothetical protein
MQMITDQTTNYKTVDELGLLVCYAMASHKSSPSSIHQDYVEMVTGVEGAPQGGLPWHMLAIRTLGHMGRCKRCGGDTL